MQVLSRNLIEWELVKGTPSLVIAISGLGFGLTPIQTPGLVLNLQIMFKIKATRNSGCKKSKSSTTQTPNIRFQSKQ